MKRSFRGSNFYILKFNKLRNFMKATIRLKMTERLVKFF